MGSMNQWYNLKASNQYGSGRLHVTICIVLYVPLRVIYNMYNSMTY